MKNVKKFLVGVFALSAMMLAACAGQNQPSISLNPNPPAASSNTPAGSTDQPAGNTSQGGGAEGNTSEAGGADTSSEDPAQEGTTHTVTLNEAPTAGRVVLVHGWKGTDYVTVEATVSGAAITFDLLSDDWEGYVIAELKEGKTFNDGLGEGWANVARQTNNITNMSATTATWQTVAPTTEYALTLDESATTAYAGRTFFVCSWKSGYTNVYDFFTEAGDVEIATDADGFLVAVLKEGKTEADGTADDWSNVENASKSDNVTSLPQESLKVYAANGKLSVTFDGGEAPAVKGDFFIGVAPAGDWDNSTFVNLTVNPSNENEYMALNVELGAGDIFYFQTKFGGTDAWLHYSAMKNDSSAKDSFEDANDRDHNFKVKTAGHYNFYVTSSQVYIEEYTPAA